MSAVDAFETHAASFESWRRALKTLPMIEGMTMRRIQRLAARNKQITVGHVAGRFRCSLPIAFRALEAATHEGFLSAEGGGPGESLCWRAA